MTVGRIARSGISFPGRAPSLLCLHGFCGVPEEMRPLIEAGRSLGLSVLAPLLPGHGAGPKQLRSFRYSDWYSAAEAQFLSLTKRGPVLLAGMSMGSIVASELSAKYPDRVLGLIALANPFWIRRPFPATALWLVDRLDMPDFGFPWRTEEPSQRAFYVQPVHAAVSVAQAASRVRHQLREIRVPTLVFHGATDRACPVHSASRYAKRLGTSSVRVCIVPDAGHMVTLGKHAAAMTREVIDFIASLSTDIRSASDARTLPELPSPRLRQQ